MQDYNKKKKIATSIRYLQRFLVFCLALVGGKVYLDYAIPKSINTIIHAKTVDVMEEKLPSLVHTYFQNEDNLNVLAHTIIAQSEKSMPNPNYQVPVHINPYIPQILSMHYPGQDKIQLQKTQDVMIVEFLDYRCILCKRMTQSIKNIKKSHQNVKVKYIEYPIFGDLSIITSTVALATSEQGLYHKMHMALMEHKQVNYQKNHTFATILDIAKNIGVDVEKLQSDMRKPVYMDILRANLKLGQNLGIQGTPYLLVLSPDSNGVIVGEEIKGYIATKPLQKIINRYTQD